MGQRARCSPGTAYKGSGTWFAHVPEPGFLRKPYYIGSGQLPIVM